MIGFSTFACSGIAASAGDDGPSRAATLQTGQHPYRITRVITKTVEVSYLLYLPPEYNTDTEKRWPMLMFLHGMGERGDDLEKVKAHGPAKYIHRGQHYPFIVVTPQCSDDAWWDADVLAALLDALAESVRVDPERVYLTGLSMGGFGTWHLAARQPERFAAIAPICGGGKVADAPRLTHLPIWAFHGEQDRVVPPQKSKEMVEAVNQAGGHAKLTLYPHAGHDSWTETYENPELYRWLLSHRRGTPSD
jgi:predicted peptidase